MRPTVGTDAACPVLTDEATAAHHREKLNAPPSVPHLARSFSPVLRVARVVLQPPRPDFSVITEGSSVSLTEDTVSEASASTNRPAWQVSVERAKLRASETNLVHAGPIKPELFQLGSRRPTSTNEFAPRAEPETREKMPVVVEEVRDTSSKKSSRRWRWWR